MYKKMSSVSGRSIWCKGFALLQMLFFSFLAIAQKNSDIPRNNRVVINYQEYIVYADIKTDERKPRARDKFLYHWYNSNDIKKTRGGYDGKLLHGKYTEFYPQKDLRTKGKFRNGRKKGKWKSWYPDGQFKEITVWKRNGRVGKFKMFAENGEQIRKGKLKNDRYHGVIREINGKKVTTRRYVNGIEQKPDTLKASHRKRYFGLMSRKKRSAKDSLSIVPEEKKAKEIKQKTDSEKAKPSSTEKKQKKDRKKKGDVKEEKENSPNTEKKVTPAKTPAPATPKTNTPKNNKAGPNDKKNKD